jgi:hypothetical protein
VYALAFLSILLFAFTERIIEKQALDTSNSKTKKQQTVRVFKGF